MKRFVKPAVLLFAFFAALIFNGCILDAFDTLIQKVPLSATVNIESANTNAVSSGTVCLDSSATYRSYKGKIKSISFAQATFVTSSVTPATLQADIKLSLSLGTNVIFTRQYSSLKPADYIGDASKFNLELNDAEKATLNGYLNNSSNVYTAKVEVLNVSGFTGTYKLSGRYDIALTLEVNP